MSSAAMLSSAIECIHKGTQVAEATDLINRIRMSSEVIQVSVECLCTTNEDVVRFQCLGIIGDVVENKYHVLTENDRSLLVGNLLSLVPSIASGNEYTKNKFALCTAIVFQREFTTKWFAFFDYWYEVLNAAGPPVTALGNAPPPLRAQGPNIQLTDYEKVADLFLRTLSSINVLVHDKLDWGPNENPQLNAAVKDQMRAHSVPQLVAFWRSILFSAPLYADGVVAQTLSVMSQLADWIDTDLMMDPELLSVLFSFVGQPSRQASVFEVLRALYHKKMMPNLKVTMIASFGLLEQVSHHEIFESSFLALAQVMGEVVLQFALIYKNVTQNGSGGLSLDELAQMALPYVEAVVGVLASPISAISNTVLDPLITFVEETKEYGFFRDQNPLPGALDTFYKMVSTAVARATLPDDYLFEDDDPNDELAVYRESLVALVVLSSSIHHGAVCEFLVSSFTGVLSGENASLAHLEALLACINGVAASLAPTGQAPSLTQPILVALVQKDVLACTHVGVKFQAYDLVLRSADSVGANEELLHYVLNAWLDKRGVLFPHERVRDRMSSYFSLFVGKVAPYLKHQVAAVLQYLSWALSPIAAMSHGLSSEDQRMIYRSIGILLRCEPDPQNQRSYLEAILAGIVETLSAITAGTQPSTAAQITHYVNLLNSLNKELKGKVEPNGPMSVFAGVLPLVLSCLSMYASDSVLKASTTVFLHCMMRVLGPRAVFEYGSIFEVYGGGTVEDLINLFSLLNQGLVLMKSEIVDLIEPLLLPLIGRVTFHIGEDFGTALIADQGLKTEIGRETSELRRAYLLFIHGIMTYNAGSALQSPRNSPYLSEILRVALFLARASDVSSQKSALQVLRKSIEVFATQVAGFADFVVNYIVPLCFEIPMAESMGGAKEPGRLSDSQSTTVLFAEVSNTVRTAAIALGDPVYMKIAEILRSNGMVDETIQLWLQALHGSAAEAAAAFRALFP